MPVTGEAVTLILASIDRIKEILAGFEATEVEPEGEDGDLIVSLSHGRAGHGGDVRRVYADAGLLGEAAAPEASAMGTPPTAGRTVAAQDHAGHSYRSDAGTRAAPRRSVAG